MSFYIVVTPDRYYPHWWENQDVNNVLLTVTNTCQFQNDNSTTDANLEKCKTAILKALWKEMGNYLRYAYTVRTKPLC